MKRLLVIVAAILLMACLDKIAEGQVQCRDGVCTLPPTSTGWRASAQRNNSFPLGGRLVPVRPIIRPVQTPQPRAQINVQPATPQVIVQRDPSAVRAADSLARIAQNTEPPPLPEQPQPKPKKQMTPLLAGLVILLAAIAGFFIFFRTQEH